MNRSSLDQSRVRGELLAEKSLCEGSELKCEGRTE